MDQKKADQLLAKAQQLLAKFPKAKVKIHDFFISALYEITKVKKTGFEDRDNQAYAEIVKFLSQTWSSQQIIQALQDNGRDSEQVFTIFLLAERDLAKVINVLSASNWNDKLIVETIFEAMYFNKLLSEHEAEYLEVEQGSLISAFITAGWPVSRFGPYLSFDLLEYFVPDLLDKQILTKDELIELGQILFNKNVLSDFEADEFLEFFTALGLSKEEIEALMPEEIQAATLLKTFRA